MSVEPIGVVTILFGLIALFRGDDFAFSLFVPLTLLGAAGAILLGGSGTIQPAHLMLGFVAITVFNRPGRLGPVVYSLTFPREGFWFCALAAYGIAGAFLLPRLFAGATDINAIGSTEQGTAVVLVPLGPTSGNLTQSIYLIADLVCFLAVLTYAATPRGFANVVKALLVYAGANIAFAVIDLVTGLTGTGFLLDVIRNADYQLHLEETTGGLRRIVGSFTETSAFSYAAVGSLGFTAQLWLVGFKPWLTGALSFASLALLAFSTSSTAYVATPVLLAVLYVGSAARATRGRASAMTFVFLAIAPLAAILLGLTVALTPAASRAILDFLDVAIFEKSVSQSGMERAQWNQTALQNFIDTYGMGGGLGSIRASSFLLAVLSNLGVIGVFCFGMILLRIFLTPRAVMQAANGAQARGAAQTACIGILMAATVSGALVDLGLPFYIFAGLACAHVNQQMLPCDTTARDAHSDWYSSPMAPDGVSTFS